MQRVHTFAGQCGGGGRHETAMVDNHGMADGVDATTSRTSGQLGELPRRKPDVPGAVVFLKFLDHYATRRHIDSQSQCLRGEHHFDKTFLEQTFDNLTEQGDHAGMMRCKSFLQGKAELRKMQSLQILLAELSIDHLIDNAECGAPHRCWSAPDLR